MTSLISLRISEVTADDTGGLHFQPRRVLWTLSWIQHHLIYRDCLLVHHCALSKHFKKMKENSKSSKNQASSICFATKGMIKRFVTVGVGRYFGNTVAKKCCSLKPRTCSLDINGISSQTLTHLKSFCSL